MWLERKRVCLYVRERGRERCREIERGSRFASLWVSKGNTHLKKIRSGNDGTQREIKEETLGGIPAEGADGHNGPPGLLSETRSGSCYDSAWMLHIVESKTRLKMRSRSVEIHFSRGRKKGKMWEPLCLMSSKWKDALYFQMLRWKKKKCPFSQAPLCLEVCFSSSQSLAHPPCILFLL